MNNNIRHFGFNLDLNNPYELELYNYLKTYYNKSKLIKISLYKYIKSLK